METAIIIRGRMSDPRHVELEEPVSGLSGSVEVVLRAVSDAAPPARRDVFDFIATLPEGSRSKEEIDQQVVEERATWGDR